MIFAVMMMTLALVGAARDKAVDNGDMQGRMFDAKLREMVYRLNLTDEQKTAFEPIYREYDNELHALMEKSGPVMGKESEKKLRGKDVSSEEVASSMKSRLEAQKAVLDLRIKYIDRFARVLDAKQMRRFFDVEKKMQDKLRKGHHGDRGEHHGEGRRGGMGKRGDHGDRGPRFDHAGGDD